MLHGAALTFGDVLGLFDIEAFFPNPIAIKVFPRTLALRGQPVRAVGGGIGGGEGKGHRLGLGELGVFGVRTQPVHGGWNGELGRTKVLDKVTAAAPSGFRG